MPFLHTPTTHLSRIHLLLHRPPPNYVTAFANVSAQRVDKIFRNMDKDNNSSLTYEEFVEGSKQDPTIVQVQSI